MPDKKPVPLKPGSRQERAAKAEGIDTRGKTRGQIMKEWREKRQAKGYNGSKMPYEIDPNDFEPSEESKMTEKEREAFKRFKKLGTSSAEADFILAQEEARSW